MESAGMKQFIYTISLLLVSVLLPVSCQNIPIPAPEFVSPYESYTNETIDRIITKSLGGTDQAANQIMDFGDSILAELDMFLTKDQFLKMYQPPDPEDMMAMGMMPAPLGTMYDEQERNFLAPDLIRKRRSERDQLPEGRTKRETSKSHVPLERSKRKAASDISLRWPDQTMPYRFANHHFEGKEEYMMRRSMTEWERYTCMTFRPATDNDKNLVHFQNGVGCNSQLGMVGGVQMLNLQAPGCRFKGLYLHEIGHALGLVHEHQLPNRDEHIRILYNNVSPNMRIWFNKYTNVEVDQMEVPYELSSVMHYGITAFSKDGKSQTIKALDKGKESTIGRVYLKELAYTDVEIINKMYHCADHCTDKTKCGPKGHLDQNCECICEDGSRDCDRNRGGSTSAGCVNLFDSWSCYIWANQGECDRNSFYMHKYCTKACHKCGDDNDDGSCKDLYKEAKCRMWKSRGDCVSNPGWMKRNCKATCNLCQGHQRPEVACEDGHEENEKCEKWALEGECRVNAQWMFKQCRKSCQLCDKDGVDVGGSSETGDHDKLECKNTHKNCETWAKSGECQSNPDWMINNCRKACDKCDDGQCKNLYDDTKCEIWEQKQECLSNHEWMSMNCAKQCRTNMCKDMTTKGGTTSKITPGGTTRTPSETTTNGNCRNLHTSDTQCNNWAKNDHCSINPSWMLKFCSKACNRCGNVRTTTQSNIKTTTSSEGEAPLPECEDTNTQCGVWAKHGFCDSNPRYNLIHCKKSCNNCNGCRDTEVLCSVWAKAGHCEQNARFMLRRCQKSCKACKTNTLRMAMMPTQSTARTTQSTHHPGSASDKLHYSCIGFIVSLCYLLIRTLL